jgi:hypothetical protein
MFQPPGILPLRHLMLVFVFSFLFTYIKFFLVQSHKPVSSKSEVVVCWFMWISVKLTACLCCVCKCIYAHAHTCASLSLVSSRCVGAALLEG